MNHFIALTATAAAVGSSEGLGALGRMRPDSGVDWPKRFRSVPPVNEDSLSGGPAAVPEFKDRRTGLIIFGVVEILLGALCLLLVGLIALSQQLVARTSATEMNSAMMIPMVGVYLGLACILISLGIGS